MLMSEGFAAFFCLVGLNAGWKLLLGTQMSVPEPEQKVLRSTKLFDFLQQVNRNEAAENVRTDIPGRSSA